MLADRARTQSEKNGVEESLLEDGEAKALLAPAAASGSFHRSLA